MLKRIYLIVPRIMIVSINIIVAFFAQLIIMFVEESIISFYIPDTVKNILNNSIEYDFLFYITLFLFPLCIIVSTIIMIIIKKVSTKNFLTQSVVMIGVLVIIIIVINIAKLELKEFNRDIWFSDIGVRQYMVDDLQNNFIVKGMSKDEVILLLGKPDYTDDNRIGYKYGEYNFGNYDIYGIEFKGELVESSY